LILGKFLLSWSLWPKESSCVGSGFLLAKAAMELFEAVLAGGNSPEQMHSAQGHDEPKIEANRQRERIQHCHRREPYGWFG
jgi:hypothetical protein